jgi:hypothetical protein
MMLRSNNSGMARPWPFPDLIKPALATESVVVSTAGCKCRDVIALQ